MNYVPKENRNALIKSINNSIRDVLLHMPDALVQHKRKLLDRALWMLTEVDGKYNIRYYSKKAFKIRDKKQLRHEHVYPRKFIIDSLFEDPGNYSNIIDEHAIACIVTKDEHDTLDNNTDGWERYKRAGIDVLDLKKDNDLKNPKHNSVREGRNGYQNNLNVIVNVADIMRQKLKERNIDDQVKVVRCGENSVKSNKCYVYLMPKFNEVSLFMQLVPGGQQSLQNEVNLIDKSNMIIDNLDSKLDEFLIKFQMRR